MIESKHERELALVMKCIKIKYNGVEVTGEQAFRQLVIDVDVLGKESIIDWDKGEITVK